MASHEPSPKRQELLSLADRLEKPTNDEACHRAGKFCVELCCGRAGLTSAMQRYFCNCCGVDRKVKHPKAKIVCLDLDNPENQGLVLNWVSHADCLWAHFGLPNDTAIKARNVPLQKHKHGPLPLRSFEWPDCLPNLQKLDQGRVRAANRLYKIVQDVILRLQLLDKIWTVESPSTTYLWETSYWRVVDSTCHPICVEARQCMFGGQRTRKVSLAGNTTRLRSMNILMCDKYLMNICLGSRNS